MNKNNHVYIPFDRVGNPFTRCCKIRVFQSVDNAAKVGFSKDSLVEYAPVEDIRAEVEADVSKLQANEKIKVALGIFREIERELFVRENENSIVVCFYRGDYEALKEKIFKAMEERSVNKDGC